LNSYIPIKEIDEAVVSAKKNSFVGSYVRSDGTLENDNQDDGGLHNSVVMSDGQLRIITLSTESTDSRHDGTDTSTDVLTSRKMDMSCVRYSDDITPVILIQNSNARHVVDTYVGSENDAQVIQNDSNNDDETLNLCTRNTFVDMISKTEESVEEESRSTALYIVSNLNEGNGPRYEDICDVDATDTRFSSLLPSSVCGSGYNIVKARRKECQSEIVDEF